MALAMWDILRVQICVTRIDVQNIYSGERIIKEQQVLLGTF